MKKTLSKTKSRRPAKAKRAVDDKPRAAKTSRPSKSTRSKASSKSALNEDKTSKSEKRFVPSRRTSPAPTKISTPHAPLRKTFHKPIESSDEAVTPAIVVGMGAAAGGVTAIRKFLAQLRNEEWTDKISFILLQHLEDAGGGIAFDLLRKQSSWPVDEIRAGMTLTGGKFFRAPPEASVRLENGIFQVEVAAERNAQGASMDRFFRSLAGDRRQFAIGVIFSGDGSDGAQGLKAISDAGGMTLAQMPETADFPSMPQAAIATGAVDHVLLAEDMPARITSYVNFLSKLAKDDHSAQLRDEIIGALGEICEILLKITRHDFKHYKTSTLVRRIERRMQVLQIAQVDGYVDRLNQDGQEIDALFKELLINVTSFFRDPAAFETLKDDVLRRALESRKPDQKYRVWVAGCSTGEEVYSLAILIREVIGQLPHAPEVQIIATDIDEVALNQARKGSYPSTIAENVSPTRLKRFFERKAGRFVVTKELRELVLFSSHNLINDPPFSQLDLVSCRNVLIYLGTHLQKKLIPVFHYALRKGGYLFLGNSETLATHKELFRTVSAKFRIAQRKATSIRPPGFGTGPANAYVSFSMENQQSHEIDVHLISQRIVLDEFSPKYAVVNEDGQIVSVSAGIARYLDPSEGSFQNNLMRLVQPSLRVGLRSTFNESKKTKRKVTHQDSSLKIEDEFVRIGITVQPMPQLGDEAGLYMVVFHYFGILRGVESVDAAHGSTAIPNYLDVSIVEQLERELNSLRTDLDRSVEDLEASNEELKSSNEELLSMNEELQSANEELETSKEEVQTVNETLQRSNNDLENLLASTEIATLFLDSSLRIQSFTPQLGTIFNITEVDIGRPIAHLTTLAKVMPPLPDPGIFDLEDTILEADIEMLDGRWVLRRILPYRTSEGSHSGLVVTFIDVTHLRVAEERYRQLANSMPQIVWTSDARGAIEYFNDRWYEYSGLTGRGGLGQEWMSIIHPDDLNASRESWQLSLETGERYETEYRMRAANGHYRWFLARAVPTRGAQGQIVKWYGSAVDIHDRVMAEERRRESERRFQIMADTAPVLIWMTGVDHSTDWVNRRWQEWTGRTIEQEIQGWRSHCHPDDVDRVRETYRRNFDARKEFQCEFRLLHRSGEYRWLSERGVPRFTPDGSFEGYIGGCMDIHEQKTAAERIRRSEQRLDLLIKTSPSFMCTLRGPNYVFEQANERYLELIGDRDVIGKPLAEALPELADQEFLGLLDQVRITGRPFIGSERPFLLQRFPDTPRETRYLDFVYQPVASMSGAEAEDLDRIFVHGSDVTEKVLARSVIERSKEQVETERANFRNLFRQTPEMVCILSGPEHVFEFVNESHIKVLGFDATGMTLREAQPESVQVHDILDSVYRTGKTAELNEIPVTVGMRLRYFNLTYAARMDLRGDINGVMILGTEVTEQVRGREDLQNARDEAEQARVSAELANESKTRFLANMSHEIRTPLAAILGFSELLQGRTKTDDAEASDQLHRISRNAAQLGRLIDELLDLSKIEAEKLEMDRCDFELMTALDDALSSVSLRAREKGLSFELRSLGEVPSLINTDPTRFRQVLTNIIGNAVKFTESGRIDVEFELLRKDAKSFLRIRVKDTGIGLSPEQQARIFEPFVQGDTSVTRKYGGTGLGLVLSKRLSMLMGGDLVLEQSALGKGSSFLVTIGIEVPTASGRVDFSKPRREVTLNQETARASLKGMEILIVDDSVDNQTIITLYLRAVQAAIEVANNGLEACERMKTKRYDIVLMDIQMPVLDGYRALKLANQNGYRGPIVALTAHAMKEEKDRCLAAGFTDYLSKPIDRQYLVQRILEIVNLNSSQHSQVALDE